MLDCSLFGNRSILDRRQSLLRGCRDIFWCRSGLYLSRGLFHYNSLLFGRCRISELHSGCLNSRSLLNGGRLVGSWSLDDGSGFLLLGSRGRLRFSVRELLGGRSGLLSSGLRLSLGGNDDLLCGAGRNRLFDGCNDFGRSGLLNFFLDGRHDLDRNG